MMGKHIKRLLTVLFSAALTSSWWAAAWLGWGDLKGLWALATGLTIFAAVFVAGYCAENWEE